MSGDRAYTDDQLVGGICNALAAGDIGAVEAIMLVLTRQNPHRAQEVFDTMCLGLRIRADQDLADAVTRMDPTP